MGGGMQCDGRQHLRRLSRRVPGGVAPAPGSVNGDFFQVLEGEHEVVAKLFDRIAADPRHGNTVKIIEEPIEKRNFGEWSMGYAKVSRDALRGIEGLNDFFSAGRSYTALDQGRAKELLRAFREGRWRTKVS
ncbi:MAG: BLUF domain-containing protein [Gammaproteobacteria bacterium]|nr:BLUF domain-containing protein [Gammaproteobacteria bacterium]